MFTNNFDPVAFSIFSLEFRWYSLAYIAGILIGWVYCKKKLIKDQKILVNIFLKIISEIPSFFNTTTNSKLKTTTY